MKRLIFLLMLCLLTLPVLCQAAKSTILVIESYHAEYAWDASYKEGLEEVLGQTYNMEYFEMDTKRIPADQYEKRADLAFKKYQKLNPVMVILGDDNALKLLGPKLSLTKTPVVYLGVNQNPRNYNMFGPENITGVLERPLMKRSILFLKELLNPAPKKILILFDNGTTSQSSVEQVFKGKDTTSIAGIKTDLKLIGNLDVWKETVLS
ncbi:MAG: sugar ABC transporter, partial [Pseudomonadota bacterium]